MRKTIFQHAAGHYFLTENNDCKNPYSIIHSDGEDFLHHIVSMCMIDIKHHINAL